MKVPAPSSSHLILLQMEQHSSANPGKTRKVKRIIIPAAPALVVSGLKGGEEGAQAPPSAGGAHAGGSGGGRSHGKH